MRAADTGIGAGAAIPAADVLAVDAACTPGPVGVEPGVPLTVPPLPLPPPTGAAGVGVAGGPNGIGVGAGPDIPPIGAALEPPPPPEKPPPLGNPPPPDAPGPAVAGGAAGASTGTWGFTGSWAALAGETMGFACTA